MVLEKDYWSFQTKSNEHFSEVIVNVNDNHMILSIDCLEIM